MTGIWLILASWALWSLDPIVIYMIGGEVNRLLVAGIGTFSGGLALCYYVLQTVRRFPLLKTRHIALIFIQAVLFAAVASVCYVYSIRYLNPGIVSVILRTQIAFAVIWAIWLLHERMNRISAAGILLIFGANVIMLINAVAAQAGSLGQNTSFLGWALAFAAALLWSGATITGKELLKVTSPLQLTSVRLFFAGSAMLLVFFLTSGPGPIVELTGRQWVLLLVEGIVTSGMGYVLYYYGLRRTQVYVASAVEPVAPFYTLIISYFFLHKVVAPGDMIGVVALLSGSAVVVIGNILQERRKIL